MNKDDTFLINVQIGGLRLPLRIERKDEEVYRKAEKLLNQKFDDYQKNFNQRPTEEILKIVAYQFAVNLCKKEFEDDVAPLAERIKSLDEELKALLSKEQ